MCKQVCHTIVVAHDSESAAYTIQELAVICPSFLAALRLMIVIRSCFGLMSAPQPSSAGGAGGAGSAPAAVVLSAEQQSWIRDVVQRVIVTMCPEFDCQALFAHFNDDLVALWTAMAEEYNLTRINPTRVLARDRGHVAKLLCDEAHRLTHSTAGPMCPKCVMLLLTDGALQSFKCCDCEETKENELNFKCVFHSADLCICRECYCARLQKPVPKARPRAKGKSAARQILPPSECVAAVSKGSDSRMALLNWAKRAISKNKDKLIEKSSSGSTPTPLPPPPPPIEVQTERKRSRSRRRRRRDAQ